MMHQERGFTMLMHSLVLAAIAYCVMTWGLGESPYVAEDRAMLVLGAALLWMVLWGHGMPGKLNHNVVML
jgi:hypothetical protein